jgi:hypothetical protein
MGRLSTRQIATHAVWRFRKEEQVSLYFAVIGKLAGGVGRHLGRPLRRASADFRTGRDQTRLAAARSGLLSLSAVGIFGGGGRADGNMWKVGLGRSPTACWMKEGCGDCTLGKQAEEYHGGKWWAPDSEGQPNKAFAPFIAERGDGSTQERRPGETGFWTQDSRHIVVRPDTAPQRQQKKLCLKG